MGPLHFLWLSEMWNVEFHSWQQCALVVIHFHTTDLVSKASFLSWILSIFLDVVPQNAPKHEQSYSC